MKPHSHADPFTWDIRPPFEDEPSKGKSKVYCALCGAFLGLKPGAWMFRQEPYSLKPLPANPEAVLQSLN